MQPAQRREHRRRAGRAGDAACGQHDPGDGDLEAHAGVPAPDHLVDQLDVPLVVAPVAAVAALRHAGSRAGVSHMRRVAGATPVRAGEVADGEASALGGRSELGLRGEGFWGHHGRVT